jgi:hypothetical protein
MLAKKTGVLYSLPTTGMTWPAESASTLDLTNNLFELNTMAAPLVLE